MKGAIVDLTIRVHRRVEWHRRILVLMLASCTVGWSQIVFDGSLGLPGPLTGPNFKVTADLGKQVGANLFHSFSEFNLKSGEAAVFSGPSSVAHILSRVTGPNVSSIDGTLSSTIPAASFFLMNPNGVVIGPNATLDVSGSFAATSANYIALSDGGRFDATTHAEASRLTGATPSAYGFVNADHGRIRMTGGQLAVPGGRFVHLVGGGATIERGTIQAPEGEIRLQAVIASSEVPLTFSPAVGGEQPAPLLAQQNDVVLRGGQILLEGAEISTGADQESNLGDITLTAQDIKLTAASKIVVGPTPVGIGRAGSANIFAGALRLNGGSQITADTDARGTTGGISVRADSVEIDGSVGTPSGLFARALPGATSPGGGITIQTGSLSLSEGAQISTDTQSESTGGDLTIQARRVVIQGTGGADTGLFTGTQADAGGPAGRLQVESDDLQILDGGRIDVSTRGTGDGGELLLAGRTIEIDGQNAKGASDVTGIVGNSEGTARGGRAGDLRIAATSLSIRNGGTSGAGIFANTQGSGDAGNLDLAVDRLTLEEGASIRSLSEANADGGVAGQMRIRARQLVSLQGGSSIVSDSKSSDGGLVSIEAGSRVELDRSSITARSNGNGGEIEIGASDRRIPQLFLNAATISADSLVEGNGGSIRLETDLLLVSAESRVTASATLGNEGKVTQSGLEVPTTDVVQFPTVLPEEILTAVERQVDTAATVTGYVTPGAERMVQERRRFEIGRGSRKGIVEESEATTSSHVIPGIQRLKRDQRGSVNGSASGRRK